MVFKGLDGPFGHIHLMVVWFNKSDITLVFPHEVFDWGHSLVVGDVEGRRKSTFFEHGEDLFECGDNIIVCS